MLSTDELSEALAQVPGFSRLAPEDRAELARLAKRITCRKGDRICWQGDIWPNVLYLASGRMKWVVLSPDGKRQVVFTLEGGDVIWGHSLFDDLPMPATLEVQEPCEAYLWPRDLIVPVFSRSVEAVWDVTRILVAAMRRVREVVYGFAFQQVSQRLARLLLKHYRPTEGKSAPRDLTLDEMADMVGTTRELVCRVLYRFADEDMIRITRTRFVFTNWEALEELASGDR